MLGEPLYSLSTSPGEDASFADYHGEERVRTSRFEYFYLGTFLNEISKLDHLT